MYPTLELPALDVRLHSYNLAIVSAAVVFLLVVYLRNRSLDDGWPAWKAFVVGSWLLIAAILGARVGYLWLSDGASVTLRGALGIASAGHSSVGAVGLAIAAAAVAVGVPAFSLSAAHLARLALPAGLASFAVVRLGCFLGGCCVGGPTTSPLGVTFPGTAGPVHPLQLYQAAANATLAAATLLSPRLAWHVLVLACYLGARWAMLAALG